MSYTTLVHYREETNELTKDTELIQIDSEDVVIGLQALGIKPVDAKTDGKKLVVEFVKEEVLEPFQRINASLAGAASAPLLVDYNQILLARLGWKGLLTMMRNVPIQK